jgi:hypothetical protein
MQLDLDEFWPDSASLVGMQFRTAEDFARAQRLLMEHLDVYRWEWEQSRTIAVRRTDLPLFRDAALAYAEVAVGDAPERPTADQRARQREGLRRAMTWWLNELGWAK